MRLNRAMTFLFLTFLQAAVATAALRCEQVFQPDSALALQNSSSSSVKLQRYSIMNLETPSGPVSVLIDPQSTALKSAVQQWSADANLSSTKDLAQALARYNRLLSKKTPLLQNLAAPKPLVKLEDLATSSRDLYLALYAKTILDSAPGKRTVSLVKLKGSLSGVGKEYYAVAVRWTNGATEILLPQFSDLPLGPTSDGIIDVTTDGRNLKLRIETAPVEIQTLDPIPEKNKNSFVIVAGKDKVLNFNVLGRTPSERRFKEEQVAYEDSGPDDAVTIEWLFNPFYFPLGHTTFRVGEGLFEFTTKGWESHADGTDSARAFLFNNPFFKSQYRKYQSQGMPPFSLGVSLSMRKSQVADFLKRIKDGNADPFSLFNNNCNQCMLRTLQDAGINVADSSGYAAFSSVLTFRKLLLETQGPVNVYPIAGVDLKDVNLRELVPSRLYDANTATKEILRNLKMMWQNYRARSSKSAETPEPAESP
jgi:hypothetical protein